MKEGQKKKKKENGESVDPNKKLEQALTLFDLERKFGPPGSIERLIKFYERREEEREIKKFLDFLEEK